MLSEWLMPFSIVECMIQYSAQGMLFGFALFLRLNVRRALLTPLMESQRRV